MLLPIERVLNEAELTQIQTQLKTASFVDGRVTAGVQSAQVKQNLQLPEGAPVTAELRRIVLAALARNPVFTSAALPRHIYPPLFNRYGEGMQFGNHVDNAIRGREQPIRTDVSCTLFLADPASYDGGELVIDDTYGAHEVKLNAGDLILYPSTSVHRVLPVTRGNRDACFFWLQSMVRDDGQRNLLFNLDVAIQRLKQRLNEVEDSAEIVSLTATYHNLLRQWAEL